MPTSNLTKSFATLVKYNNGFFKSEKQARFLLAHCINGIFYGESHNTYNNITRNEYHCDQTGIISIYKYSQTKETLTQTWERQADQAFQSVVKNRVLKNKLGNKMNKLQNNKMNKLQKRIKELNNTKALLFNFVINEEDKGIKEFKLWLRVRSHIEALTTRLGVISDQFDNALSNK